MQDHELMAIDLTDYKNQSDDVLFQIMARFSTQHSNQEFMAKYKLAYDVLNMRTNISLVNQTMNLVEKTLRIAKWTMIVAIGTWVLALFTFMLVYYSKG